MNIDITTLAMAIGIINLLQVGALFLQWQFDKNHFPGQGWWLLGIGTIMLGFVALLLRSAPPVATISIVGNNVFLVCGQTFLYIGILRFFGQRVRRGPLIALLATYTLVAIYFTFMNNDIVLRRIALYLTLAALGFLTARAIFLNKTRIVNASANFLAATFLTHGIIITAGTVLLVTEPTPASPTAASPDQIVVMLDALITTSLWTIGFIVMANQRLGATNREAKENRELIFNTAPDAILVTRLNDGIIVEINDGFMMLTGYNRAEVIGKSTTEVNIWHNPEDRQRVITALHEKGFCENVEAVFQRKDGSQRDGMLSARIISLQGEPHIISVTRDITGRKQAEEYGKMRQEVLAILNEPEDSPDSMQRVLAVLKARTGCSAVAIRLQEGEDFPYLAQDGFSADFMRTENTLISRDVDGLMCRDKDGNVRLECTCGLVVDGRTDPANPLFTKGGSFWTSDSFPLLDLPSAADPRYNPRNQCTHHGYASFALVPLRDKERIVGLIQFNSLRKGYFTRTAVENLEKIAAHIGTALVRRWAEQALQEANDHLELRVAERTRALDESLSHAEELAVQAEAANRAKSAFLANMSHELRTPLSGVLGMTEMLFSDPLTDRQQGYAEKIKKSGAALLSIIHDILERSKIESGVVAVESIPFSLKEVIESVENSVRPRAAEKGLELHITIAPELPAALLGSPQHLTRVLTNLMNNAVVFTQAGSIKLAASIQQRTAEKLDIQIAVQDTGIGMTEEEMSRLFKSFSQADDSTTRRYGGLGLGLVTSRDLVELMGGTLRVKSASGKGSIFTVLLSFRIASGTEEVPGRAITGHEVQNPAEASVKTPARPEMPIGDIDELFPLLDELKRALESAEPKPCQEILKALQQKQWPADEEAMLAEVNHLVERYSLPEALALLEKNS